MIDKFQTPNQGIVWVHGLIDDLNFYEDDARRFERAFALLGSFIGVESQRPEAETGRGPDVLWALGGLKFLVIECKNGATSGVISKSDTDQLTGSMVWFDGGYDTSCHAVPVMVHPNNVLDHHASARDDMRVIDV